MISSNLISSHLETSVFEILFEIPQGGKRSFCARFPSENW
jgi:hypothetical protein